MESDDLQTAASYRFTRFREWDTFDDYEEDLTEILKDKLDDSGFYKDYGITWVREKVEERGATHELRKSIDKKIEDVISEETILSFDDIEPSIVDTVPSSESSEHPCLRAVEMSDSQLKLLDLHNVHSVPDDPGLAPALWVLESKHPVYSHDGVEKLNDLVTKSHLRPIRILNEMLHSHEINLRYYAVDPRIIKAICEAIEDNITIENIDLGDNWLSTDACYHLSKLLVNNNVVKMLGLSNCRIGPEGSKKLQYGLSETIVLTNLDLSGCDISNEGLKYIANAMSTNESIEFLDLSKNHLNEECSEDLCELLQSKTLQSLSLSRNSLCTAKCWETFLKGLLNSETLVSLDLSWNALDKQCVPFLGNFLSVSSTLKHLNISNNMFDQDDAKFIGSALSTNNTMEEIYIGSNPLKAEGVKILIKSIFIEELSATSLRLLDLENIWAHKDVLPEIDKIQNSRPWFKIQLRGILSNYTLKGPDVRKIFLRRANYEAMKPKKKKLRKNFSDFIGTLENAVITIMDFKKLVKKYKLKLSETLIDEITNAFADSSNLIDQGALKAYYFKTFPREESPLLQ